MRHRLPRRLMTAYLYNWHYWSRAARRKCVCGDNFAWHYTWDDVNDTTCRASGICNCTKFTRAFIVKEVK